MFLKSTFSQLTRRVLNQVFLPHPSLTLLAVQWLFFDKLFFNTSVWDSSDSGDWELCDWRVPARVRKISYSPLTIWQIFRMRTCIIIANSAQCFQKILMSAPVPEEDVEYWIPNWQTHLPYCHWCKCLSSRESNFPFCIKIPTDLQQEFPFSLGRFWNHSSELPKAHFTGASFWSGISFCAFKI